MPSFSPPGAKDGFAVGSHCCCTTRKGVLYVIGYDEPTRFGTKLNKHGHAGHNMLLEFNAANEAYLASNAGSSPGALTIFDVNAQSVVKEYPLTEQGNLTAISWCWAEPNILACSTSENIQYTVDLRDPRAKMSNRGIACVSLAWKHFDNFTVTMGSNGGQLHSWNFKRRYHSAHRYAETALMSIDWAANDPHRLLTCAEGANEPIKLWDTNRNVILNEISGNDFYQARFAPFGAGILTAKRLDETRSLVQLWNIGQLTAPRLEVEAHRGHGWRRVDADSFDLVVQKRDRIHVVTLSEEDLAALSFSRPRVAQPESQDDEDEDLSRAVRQRPQGAYINAIDYTLRRFHVNVVVEMGHQHNMVAQFRVTEVEARNGELTQNFEFLPSTTIDAASKTAMISRMNNTANACRQQNKYWIEPMVQEAITFIQTYAKEVRNKNSLRKRTQGNARNRANLEDLRRMSGAVFTVGGKLIVFTNKAFAGEPLKSPREGGVGRTRGSSASVHKAQASRFLPDWTLGMRTRDEKRVLSGTNMAVKEVAMDRRKLAEPVYIVDRTALALLFEKRSQEALDYLARQPCHATLPSRLTEVLVISLAKLQLSNVWPAVSPAIRLLSALPSVDMWLHHPCGGNLLTRAFEFCHSARDVQTLVSCVRSSRQPWRKSSPRPAKMAVKHSRQAVLCEQSRYAWVPAMLAHLAYLRVQNEHEAAAAICAIIPLPAAHYLAQVDQQDLKPLEAMTTGYASVNAASKQLCLTCAVCRLPAQLYTLCPGCGHGGHLEHLAAWFAENNECPTGCGCDCASMAYDFSGEPFA
ncbi:uncharacterized protein MONBRDRAFT_24366 [Monosiga brevicollis MX1]|uniref:WDR59/RTC1-like RING zinc finger domain-containing protein n=1 Tax=Monosiga brevicollis TaxID=81824 RepID=A9UW73_MONBE|nr:uncharacterized protein MONBRDRAFT_24366 [Monosiga brevicollis MX1]EDQ90717.1 predicted protein [Monosiga brevicollis MX1]|eukprot:XP_001744768.1 hypothetical protein [Monosiga brevicollis MX1]